MKSKMKLYFLSYSALMFAVACGDEERDPLARPTEAVGTLTAADAADAGSTFVDLLSDAASGLTDSSAAEDSSDVNSLSTLSKMNSFQALSQPLSTDACAPTVTSGDLTDADDDGVYKSVAATYNCSVAFLGLNFTLTGSVASTDKDDASKYGGFTYGLDNLTFVFSSGETTTLHADIDVTKNASTYTAKQDIVGVISASGATTTVGRYFDMTITPTSMTSPDTAGTLTSLSGFLKVAAEGAEGEGEFVLKISAANLSYGSSTCPSGDGYKNSSITLTDASNNALVVSYNASCVASATFNGAAITLD